MTTLATLRMFDSIWPQNLASEFTAEARDLILADMIASLPTGADAYLGYVGGWWPTYLPLLAKFPHSHVLGLAINASEDAEGADCEKGDLSIAQMPGWTRRQLARGVWRPVQYASISDMGSLLAADTAAGIGRSQVRLLSAHYGAGKHICGPSTCGIRPQCDGTQWTDVSAGVGGTLIDESALEPWFFTPPVPVPVPVPAAKGTDMILFEVDPKSVPKGTTWPGWFVLDGSGLRHVPNTAALEAYQALGLPVAKPLTYAHYKAIGGV